MMTQNRDELEIDNQAMIQMTSEVVAAYVSNNPVQASDLPNVISRVHATMRDLSSVNFEEPAKETSPAVSVRKSVTPDYLVCLEDGKRFKSLKRHLRSKYNLSPEEYRENGAFRPIIPWLRLITRNKDQSLPRRWALDSPNNSMIGEG